MRGLPEVREQIVAVLGAPENLNGMKAHALRAALPSYPALADVLDSLADLKADGIVYKHSGQRVWRLCRPGAGWNR